MRPYPRQGHKVKFFKKQIMVLSRSYVALLACTSRYRLGQSVRVHHQRA